MREVIADQDLVAKCGLYCGGCGAYLKEKCPGCAGNEKASWCKVRACCLERKFSSCAECGDYSAYEDCRKLNNFISRLIGLFTRSDRPASLRRVKATGLAQYAAEMAAARTPCGESNFQEVRGALIPPPGRRSAVENPPTNARRPDYLILYL